MSITKEESLEKYKQHLKDNVTYMGVGQAVLDLIENNKVAKFAISFLTQEVYGLSEENKKLRAMIDNGLGWEDMRSDGANGEGADR